MKRQKLLECVLTGNSKLYLGKVYTEEKIKELSEEEVEKLFNNYEAKLSGQMVKSLGKSIIDMYSMGVCTAIGISNQDALSEDLENDPFLNSGSSKVYLRIILQIRFVFSSLKRWNNLPVDIIYMSIIKMEEQVQQETIKMEETRKQPSRLEGH